MSDSVKSNQPLPRSFVVLVLCDAAAFITCCAVSYVDPLFNSAGYILFYPLASALAGLILLIVAIVESARRGLLARRRLARVCLGIFAAALPVVFFELNPPLVRAGVNHLALRTAPLADYQTWAIGLLAVRPQNAGDDYFPGSDDRVPAELRPFVSNFRVRVERDLGAEAPHIQLLNGGGRIEIHWAIDIGPPGFVPHDDHIWQQWADGIWFTYP